MKQMSSIQIYQSSDGQITLEVHAQKDNLWLTQAQIAELFGTKRPAITKHLGNIYKSGELDLACTSSILEHTTQHGAIKGKQQKKLTKYYNLDAVLSVGYRVNSKQATQFRIWATQVLKQHLLQGFMLNKQRFEDNAQALEQALELVRKAAHLLYFVVKNHPFSDGNKRSGAFLFVDFLHRNGRLLDKHQQPVINDTGLAALTLLVAESDPKQKEVFN